MMRKRDISAGAPCWMDLASSDVAAARTFYTGVFGWTAQEASEEFGGYFMFTAPGAGPVAGCMPAMPDAPADMWSVYLTVEDAAKTLDEAVAHGGQIVMPVLQVSDTGTTGMVADPGGAVIGVWQPGDFHGMTEVGEPGLPSWFELHTTDFDTQLKFYQDVFGWTTELAPAPFRYAMFSHGDNPLAGIMEGGEHHRWSVYVWVADADATITAAQSLGGSVVVPAEDTPYGRLATIADPNGAEIKLMAGNDQMPGA